MPRLDIASPLLVWYDIHGRDLPWRVKGKDRADPYHVWLSEIMLQQTTVATVKAYFEKFTARWPTVHDLAAASLDEVLSAWAGLGYYARARNLHGCAQKVAVMDGYFPQDEADLKALPGIGDYTAAAIAAIAFAKPAVVVDGNIERVIARLARIEIPLPKAKAEIKQVAARYTPQDRPGDYAQALMDLGATLCTPTKPQCLLCPLRPACAAHKAGIAESLPRKLPKKPKPIRRGLVFYIEADGAVLLRRRPEKGLLGGMMEFPSTPWEESALDPHDPSLIIHAPLIFDYQVTDRMVRHTFTHFHLELTLARAELDAPKPVNGATWVTLDSLATQALPTVMKKVWALAQDV